MNEIEAIFCKLLGCDRASLYLDKHASFLSPRKCHDLETILKKRLAGEPLQYILGDTDFMGLRLRVKPGVLVPRPETEILVEEAIRTIGASAKTSTRVLDIGTGSGNIAVALAKLGGDSVRIDAVDISEVCLAVAAANARHHHVADKIRFIRSDIFSALAEETVFDMIVSNPPYVTEDEFDALPEDVRREPLRALFAPHDGLYFYEEIEKGARRHLAGGGWLVLEIGEGQAQAVRALFSDTALWQDFRVIKDYNDRDRIITVSKGT